MRPNSHTPNRNTPDRGEQACERISDLALRMEQGHLPTDEERARLAQHLRSCETCRLDRAVGDVLAHCGDSGPAEPLDEFRRRRFVNYVVTCALSGQGASGQRGPVLDEPEGDGSSRDAHLDDGVGDVAPYAGKPGAFSPAGSRSRWRWAVAVAVLLVTGGLAAGVWRGWIGGRQDHREGAGSSPDPVARLVLRAGTVRIDGAEPDGRSELAVGSRLEVACGRAVLALPDEAYVVLRAGSELRVRRLDARHTVLHLLRGALLAKVQPRRERRRFMVTTPSGRVEVTGTVFSVRVRGAATQVRVLRGEVKVQSTRSGQRPDGQAGLTVPRGRATEVTEPGTGRAELRPLTRTEERAGEALLATLSSLEGPHTTRIAIRSRPAGARVLVDGTLLGHTPLFARVKAGDRLLAVRHPYRSPVQERLALRPGDRVARDYELGAATPGSQAQLQPLPRRGPEAAEAPAEMSPEDEPPMELAPEVVRRRAPARRPRGRAHRGRAGRPRPPSLPVDARSLLRRARQRRAARDWSGAARAYRALLRHRGHTPEAGAARVALGLLLLDHLGSPAGALRLFDRYLAGTRRGPLAQEAAYGRIRALHRLGRRAAELRALREFLHLYPGALQEPLVRRRIEVLSRTKGSPAAGPHGGSRPRPGPRARPDRDARPGPGAPSSLPRRTDSR